MGFNQTYSAINRAWEANFKSQVPEREATYVSDKMRRLQTAFQDKQYQEAITTTKILFGYFSLIAHKEESTPLKKSASKIKEHLWSLERILEKNCKRVSV